MWEVEQGGAEGLFERGGDLERKTPTYQVLTIWIVHSKNY
jgi:hypothetical protein